MAINNTMYVRNVTIKTATGPIKYNITILVKKRNKNGSYAIKVTQNGIHGNTYSKHTNTSNPKQYMRSIWAMHVLQNFRVYVKRSNALKVYGILLNYLRKQNVIGLVNYGVPISAVGMQVPVSYAHTCAPIAAPISIQQFKRLLLAQFYAIHYHRNA